jgi:hypothetical protein
MNSLPIQTTGVTQKIGTPAPREPEYDPDGITWADVGTALTNASAKAAQKHARRGSKAAGVFEAIFDIRRVPAKLQRLFLYLAAYAAGRTHFKAFLGEVAPGYYDEETCRQPGQKRNREDDERARKAREQRFGALLQEAADWCESRDGVQLLTYSPGICVDGQSERGSFGLPLLDLYARIYVRARSTSSFTYKREAALKRVAEEVIDEFDFPPPPQRRQPRTKDRDTRIKQEQATVQTRNRRLCAQQTEQEAEKHWRDLLTGLPERDLRIIARIAPTLIPGTIAPVPADDLPLIENEQRQGVQTQLDEADFPKSRVVAGKEPKGVTGQLVCEVGLFAIKESHPPSGAPAVAGQHADAGGAVAGGCDSLAQEEYALEPGLPDEGLRAVELFACVGAAPTQIIEIDDSKPKKDQAVKVLNVTAEGFAPNYAQAKREADARGYSLAVRIAGPVVQVDDCDYRTAQLLRPFAFAVVLTSPGSYQAWLAFKDEADKEATKGRFFSGLRELLPGTKANGGAGGAMRWPGSENRKPIHRTPSGKYPTVEIEHAAPGRFVMPAELDEAGLLAAEPGPLPTPISRDGRWPNYDYCLSDAPPKADSSGEPDLSRVDARWVTLAFLAGHSREEIAAQLLNVSAHARDAERQPLAYAQKTADAVGAYLESRGHKLAVEEVAQ